MELSIVTAAEALAVLEEGWPNKAVSLVGDDLRFPLESLGPYHLILRFHDVEAEVVAPTEEQLREALAYTKDLGAGARLLDRGGLTSRDAC